MIRSTDQPPDVTVGAEVIRDPGELGKLHAQRERLHKNMAWFEAHATEIGRSHPGRLICVAGGELFVGDDPKEVYARARAAHPDDWGAFFTKYIPARGES